MKCKVYLNKKEHDAYLDGVAHGRKEEAMKLDAEIKRLTKLVGFATPRDAVAYVEQIIQKRIKEMNK